MDCPYCGKEVSRSSEYLIGLTNKDGQIKCVSCDRMVRIDHECLEDGCLEVAVMPDAPYAL